MTKPEKTLPEARQRSGVGVLVRLGWLAVGNLVLAICAIAIAKHSGSFLSPADAVFWATVAILVWLRRFDITRMGGETAAGQPATLRHWRRYVGLLFAVALALWLIAHALGWFGQ
jgi:hypothetical protein